MGHRKLIWQLYPSYLVVTLVALLAVTVYCSRSFRQVYRDQVRDELVRLADFSADEVRLIAATGGTDKLDNLCKQLGRMAADRIRLTVIAPTGQVLGDSRENPTAMENHSDRPEIREALQKPNGSSVRFSPTLGTPMMYVAEAVRNQDTLVAVVRVAAPLAEIDHALGGIYRNILWAGLATAAGVAVLSLWISRRLSQPIVGIERIAQRFAAGELDLRAPLAEPLELAALAGSFNRMATQLSERITTITEQRNKLDAILASMAEGVFAVDNKGRIVSINRAAAEFLDLDATEAQTHVVEEVVRNVDLQGYVRQTLAGVPPAEVDIALPQEGGRSFRLHGAALTDAQGRRSGAVIVLNDMTRIRRLENVRRDFVANVSHELRTPVTSIQGFAEALADGAVTDPEQVQKYLAIIAKHAARLNAIIDDLLTLSRLEETGERRALRFDIHPLRPLLAEAISLCAVKADEKRMTVELVCADEVQARINPPLLEQAIINLVDNAIKYSPEGSRIRVEARRREMEVSLTVSDEGCGIPPEHLPRIFERFYVVDKSRSRKLGGTGLGLAIVKHIAQAHGGRVAVESTVGQGSIFTLHLPG